MTYDLVQEDIAALPTDDPADGSILSERGFLMVAEGTRHVWDTPEEDKAWAHLAAGARFIAPAQPPPDAGTNDTNL